MGSRLIVLCFDIEPDDRTIDRTRPPELAGFERVLERIAPLRARLEQGTGNPVSFTWCLRMDEQIAEAAGSATWVADQYPDQLAELVEAGDDLGVHPHTWRWDPERGDWVADYVDQEWAGRCLATSLDAFESAFGRPCEVHRAGDRFLTGRLLAQLAERGVGVDLTVEPGAPQEATVGEGASSGSSPDYRRAPAKPYRSSPGAFPAPDPDSEADPLLIPLASAPRRRPPFRRWQFSLELPPAVFAQRLALQWGRRPPLMAFGVRTDAALGPRWDLMAGNLERLLRRDGTTFVAATRAAASVAGD